jgi:hypothetical protein
MASISQPPNCPPVASGDDGALRRLQFRLWQIALTAITILLCGWFFSLGVMPGIIALFIAKHVLVAILAAGLHLPPVRGEKKPSLPGPGPTPDAPLTS